MCLAIARCTSAPAEASPAQEYRLRLKVAGAHSLAKPPGARPTSEVVRQVGEEGAFRFARALR